MSRVMARFAASGVLAVFLAASQGMAWAATPPSLYPAQTIEAGLGRIADVAFSSDGRLLAAGGVRGYGVWDAQTGTLIRRDASMAGVARLTFGAQGTLLAIGGVDGRVTLVDLRSGTPREVARHAKPVSAVAFSADGRTGASGDTEGNITLWDPNQGSIAPLKDGGLKREILVLAFAGGTLLSASKDLQVVTWDSASKRPLRRATLRSDVRGRVLVPSATAVDATGDRLVVGAQLVSEQRGGVLSSSGLARPGDLRRDNLLMPYTVSTGISSDGVNTNDFSPEHVALGPGSCFAFFTSHYRDQARLHVWGLVEQGDDLTRFDLPGRAVALTVEPGGRLAAVASEAGQIRTWTVSGATAGDCDAYAKKPVAVEGPSISLGPETDPLIQTGGARRLAVLRFEATGVDPGLGDAVAEMVAGQLANNPRVTVVERGAINAIVKEMELQRSGLTASDAAKIGRGLNAGVVLFGSVRRFGESTYVVTARAVDVETQQIQGSREVTCERCKEQDLPRAIGALRRQIVP
jgi:TolB-like protein